MPTLIPANGPGAILSVYRGTAIEELLQYHNLGVALPATTGRARLLISMCMDHRKDLLLPNEFAYVLRSAGGNLQDSEFEISYAIAMGGIATVALLAHTDCGMVDVTQHRPEFVRGLVERAGWAPDVAASHFDRYASHYQIGDAIRFVCDEAKRLRRLYPAILVAPLLYAVETDRLTQIDEHSDPVSQEGATRNIGHKS